MQELSWSHEGLPDILWLAAVEQENGHLPAAHQPLDALDEFFPTALKSSMAVSPDSP